MTEGRAVLTLCLCHCSKSLALSSNIVFVTADYI